MEARLQKILKVPGLVQGVVATARGIFGHLKRPEACKVVGNDRMGELQHFYHMVAGSKN